MPTPTEIMLVEAGNRMAQRLREVREEFGPEQDVLVEDLGWDAVEDSLAEWRRAKDAVVQAAQEEAS